MENFLAANSIPEGNTTMQHFEDLKSRGTAQESFAAAMDAPKKCFSGRPIGVLPWATEKGVADLHDKLKMYDADFRYEYCNKS